MPTVTEDQIASLRRQSIIKIEMSNAIFRAQEQDAEITCLEVVAVLLALMDRYLKHEMAD